jgi:hypothetical protein
MLAGYSNLPCRFLTRQLYDCSSDIFWTIFH